MCISPTQYPFYRIYVPKRHVRINVMNTICNIYIYIIYTYIYAFIWLLVYLPIFCLFIYIYVTHTQRDTHYSPWSALGGIFLILANFSCFHVALKRHQCGEVTMRVLEPQPQLPGLPQPGKGSRIQGQMAKAAGPLRTFWIAMTNLTSEPRYESKRRNVMKNELVQTQEQMVRPPAAG